MNYQKLNQKKKKLNIHQLLLFVGTQLVKNYSLDSQIQKLEFGNHKDYTKIEKKKYIFYNFVN
jgi:hypothetical protein